MPKDSPLRALAGLATAGTVHGTKAAIRPVVNAGSGGTAAPIVSTVEDVVSFSLSLIALLIPVFVIVLLAAFVWLVVRWRRRRRDHAGTAVA